MKRAIIIVAFIGMFGWAMYEFVVSKTSDGAMDDSSDNVNIEDETDVDEKQGEESKSDEPVIGLEIGNRAPDFKLASLEGEELSLSDFRGERVMLNFWATWCPPCRAEMPDMEKFNRNEDIVILAVNLTETEPNIRQIENFKDEYDLTFSILLDEDIEVANMYGIQPIPTSYMIDSDGIIQNVAFGALTYDQMLQGFEEME